jgi:hypothetical protein
MTGNPALARPLLPSLESDDDATGASEERSTLSGRQRTVDCNHQQTTRLCHVSAVGRLQEQTVGPLPLPLPLHARLNHATKLLWIPLRIRATSSLMRARASDATLLHAA